MEQLLAGLAFITLLAASTWMQHKLSKGRIWSPLWLAFSMTFMATLFLAAGSIGFRLDRHTAFVSASRWSDSVIWWEVGDGAVFAALAVLFWRLAIRDTDRRLRRA